MDRDLLASSGRESRKPFVVALFVLGAALGMAGGFAVLFSGAFGIFVKPISAGLGWSRSQVSLMTMTAFLGYAVGAPVLGLLNDRFGAGRVLVIGIAGFALGLAGLGLAPPTLNWLLFCCLVIGLAGAATAPTGYVLILAKHFGRRLGLAIGCAMLGLGLGIAFIPVAAQRLIDAFGWRGAYLAFAAVAVVLGALALACGLGAPVAQTVPIADDSPEARTPAVIPGATLRQAMASWRFWLIAATSLAIGGAGFGAAAHLVAALSDHGVDKMTAARIAGLTGAGIFSGRIAVAILMDRVFAPIVAAACCLLGATGLILIDVTSSGQLPILSLAALFTGLLVGSEGDTMPFLTRRYFGVGSFGLVFGCIAGMAALGGIFGPLAFGMAFDAQGNYAAVLIGAALVCATSAGLLLLLGPYAYDAENRPRGRK